MTCADRSSQCIELRLRHVMNAIIVAHSGSYLESLQVVGADAIHT